MSKARNTLAGAGSGAAIGTAIAPGIGTGIGAGVGAGVGYFTHADEPKLDPTPLPAGEEFGVNYNPTGYQGGYDPSAGASGLLDVEDDLGIRGFDAAGYMADRTAGLRAGVDEDTRRNVAQVNDSFAAKGLGGGGSNRALEQEASLYGDRTFQMGKAAIRDNATQIGLAEDGRRTAGALGVADTYMQDAQFGAGFDDNQARFGAEMDFRTQQANEQQRLADHAATYGMELDQYQQNKVNPYMRDQELMGAGMQAGTDIYGARLRGDAAKKPDITGS